MEKGVELVSEKVVGVVWRHGAACAEGADGEMGDTGRGELGGAVSRGEGGTVHMAGRNTLSRRANSGVCASSSQDLSEFVVVKEVVGAETEVEGKSARLLWSGGAYFSCRRRWL